MSPVPGPLARWASLHGAGRLDMNWLKPGIYRARFYPQNAPRPSGSCR